ncbi:hypothetical protein T10_5090 [Trichinella papuae]|uniref:Reverse transcriptase domain-containing protein n=1 Tax=Trichinella papuae TaxID=268474 RepID=A0A0V1N7M5_9BILA|nr:hypothetical protein T10_5090 [Trichinella papuae]
MSRWFENLPTNAFTTIPKAWNDVHNKNYFGAKNLFNLASLFHGRTFPAERPQVAHPCFRETLNRSQFQTIWTHAKRRQHVSGETTKQIILNMYIDDFVLISDSVEEAKNFLKESTSLFMKRGFNLTGWMTLEDATRPVGFEIRLTLILAAGLKRGGAGKQKDPVKLGCNDLRSYQVFETIYGPEKMLFQVLWQERISWNEPLPDHVDAVQETWMRGAV